MSIISWYYCKLKNMSKPKNQLPINPKIPTSTSQRKSLYCFSTKDLLAPNFHPNNNSPTKTTNGTKLSRKWSRQKMTRRRRRRIRSICGGRNLICRSPDNHKPQKKKPRVSMSGCICRAAVESIWTKPTTVKHRILPPLDSDHDTCSSSDYNNDYTSNLSEYGPGHGSTFDAMLSAAFACSSSAPSTKCKANDKKQVRRLFTDEYGRGTADQTDQSSKKSSSGSCFAVVKSSRDPRGEFMQSMVEMIVENDLRGSKDLEELLLCYLTLNSQEYHNLIISVFKQIWFDLIIHI